MGVCRGRGGLLVSGIVEEGNLCDVMVTDRVFPGVRMSLWGK